MLPQGLFVGSTVGAGYQAGHASPRLLVMKRRNEDRGGEGKTKKRGTKFGLESGIDSGIS